MLPKMPKRPRHDDDEGKNTRSKHRSRVAKHHAHKRRKRRRREAAQLGHMERTGVEAPPDEPGPHHLPFFADQAGWSQWFPDYSQDDIRQQLRVCAGKTKMFKSDECTDFLRRLCQDAGWCVIAMFRKFHLFYCSSKTHIDILFTMHFILPTSLKFPLEVHDHPPTTPNIFYLCLWECLRI